MSKHPLSIRLFFLVNKKINTFPKMVKAFVKGCLLGILSRETLQSIDKAYYDLESETYLSEAHNRGGMLPWEMRSIMRFFQGCQTILVAAAGGGREVLALHNMGFDVDGFECHPELFAYAEELLRKENFRGTLQLVRRDECSEGERVYDGAIIGWGAYMLIQGRELRISFLRRMRARMREGAPLLLSFFARSSDDVYFKVIATTGNIIRAILFKERVELGDALGAEYLHFFTEGEIASELKEAGFLLQYYSTEEYGHAVGTSIKSASEE